VNETPGPANDIDGESATETPEVPDEDQAAAVTTPGSASDAATIAEEDNRWSRIAGAWALGVIDPDDQDEAAAAVASSWTLRDEIALIQPVANILRSLYQTNTAPAASIPEPTVTAESEVAPAEQQTVVAKPKRTRKPPPVQASMPFSRSMPSLPWPKILVGASVAIAVLSFLWALSLLDRIDAQEAEIDAQATQIAQLHAAGNASAYLLYPTVDGGTAQGTLYYSPANGAAVIDVINMPLLDEGRVYQVWFQQAGSSTWIPGPTFTVNSSGQAVQRLAGDAPTFAQVAISNEPSPGSSQPTGPFLLTGTLAQANG
jgi:hypothetical protein